MISAGSEAPKLPLRWAFVTGVGVIWAAQMPKELVQTAVSHSPV